MAAVTFWLSGMSFSTVKLTLAWSPSYKWTLLTVPTRTPAMRTSSPLLRLTASLKTAE